MYLIQFSEILEFIKSVPDVIWSALIASIITLSGVFLSNVSNNNRLKLQLQHDAEEKMKERTSALRREVYLTTAEELVKASSHLSNLPQIDVTKLNLADGFQGLFCAAARLQIVAEPKTSLLMGQLSAMYGELIFKLMTDLIPMNEAKIDIEIAESHYNQAQTEISRILSEQRKINESSEQDQSKFRTLQRSFKFEREQSDDHSAERNQGCKRFNQYNIIFQKRLLTEMKQISSKQIEVMIEIRQDLGLTSDIAAIEQHTEMQWSRMETHLNALIAVLQQDLEES